ncbi:hypothetical protein CR532_05190 (plasmid) [Candidatus Borreliella tachyglossi]|uniref:Uncharacterized protein n=1 Tax=Candidatus Borreliella tachyglossi TaxID=1964448 RepID=A0A2S1LYH8_9SPIR|nr:hypothetical protein [Candidatus Borreliella tachyglossi]AWG43364.1 hypothetical protein CR532_05040 [Candidatus Borreliella tachyglossi]AWG43393.1 hypothetical protein CR532_05190 [Candidatus Borreliella tachyglossi]
MILLTAYIDKLSTLSINYFKGLITDIAIYLMLPLTVLIVLIGFLIAYLEHYQDELDSMLRLSLHQLLLLLLLLCFLVIMSYVEGMFDKLDYTKDMSYEFEEIIHFHYFKSLYEYE